MEKLTWTKSERLPTCFSYLSPETDTRPTIWARRTEKGWYCQFAYMHYGVTGTGTNRDKAADELMQNWHKRMKGK